MCNSRPALALTLVLAAALAAGCNGIVGGLPVEVSGGSVTLSADGKTAVVRLSESTTRPACGTEEPRDVEIVMNVPAETGDFTIGKDASADLRLTDKFCSGGSHDDVAKSGVIHVNALKQEPGFANASGRYELVFAQGDLKGEFSANGCTLAADKNLDEPDCDDVDHDGVPGGELQGGGGCGGGD